MQRPVPLSLSPLQSSALFLPLHNRTRIYVGARTALILTLILALIYPWSGYAFACIKPYTMRLYQHGRGAVSRSLCCMNTIPGYPVRVDIQGGLETSPSIFVSTLFKLLEFEFRLRICSCDIWEKLLRKVFVDYIICVLWYMLRRMENLISILLKVFRIIKIKSWLGLYDYRRGFLKNNIGI